MGLKSFVRKIRSDWKQVGLEMQIEQLDRWTASRVPVSQVRDDLIAQVQAVQSEQEH